MGRFSLVRGGPFRALMRAVHLVRGDGADPWRQSLALVALTWVPLAAFSLVQRLATHHWNALVLDPAVHVRLLVAVPLLVVAEEVMHLLSRRCVDQFVQSSLVSDGLGIRRVLTRVTLMRDAKLPEVVLAVAALAAGEARLWGRPSGGPFAIPGWVAAPSFAGIWWGVVALPLSQFLLYRSLWRWILWADLLWRFSRLDVRPVASHPDRCGGLRFLAEPTLGFAVVVMSIDCIVAGTWGGQMVFEHVPLESSALPFSITTAVSLLVGLAPLCVFSNRMWRTRLRAVRQYDLFALEYARLFQRKWIDDVGETESPLGSADIQSMADLANSLAIVRGMRVVPLGVREVAALLAGVWLPSVPLVLLTVPLNELLKRIAGVLF
jgi:hypothetical protein